MNLKDFKEWLAKFPDDTTVKVVVHKGGLGYYDQGGYATCDVFDPSGEYGHTEDGVIQWEYSNEAYDYQDKTLTLGVHEG